MRIAYLTTDFGIPVHGHKGASIHVRELSAALSDLGHEVRILTGRAGGDAPEGFHIPVHEVRPDGEERRLTAMLRDDPAAGEAVAKEVRGMLYATSFRHRALPLLQELRPDAIYERYALHGTAGIELARELGVPHLLEVNAPLSEEHTRHRGSAYAQTLRAVERHILSATDRILVVSEPLRDWVIDTGVEPDRVSVVPNGVNLARFADPPAGARARLGLDEQPMIGFAGTLKAWHGTATLIRAAGLLSRERGIHAPHLLIAGDGPERERLEDLAREEGIADLVTFTGMVPHDEMPGMLAAMDVAVAPYDEAPSFYFSPLKLFEYMAAGRPIVAAGIGQIEEVLADGGTGLLYPPGDVAALADRIGALIDAPSRAATLGQAARATAIREHGWERNARVVCDHIAGIRSSGASMTVAAGGSG